MSHNSTYFDFLLEDGLPLFPFVEGYQVLQHLTIPVLPPGEELVGHKVQLFQVVIRHGNVGGVHEKLVRSDMDDIALSLIPDTKRTLVHDEGGQTLHS